jgi:hypothetical protein
VVGDHILVLYYFHVFLWNIMNYFSLCISDCGDVTLVAPTNAASPPTYSTAGDHIEGTTATYACNTGYLLVGSGVITCPATVVWPAATFTCDGQLSWLENVDLTNVVCNAIF